MQGPNPTEPAEYTGIFMERRNPYSKERRTSGDCCTTCWTFLGRWSRCPEYLYSTNPATTL